ncbi:MAG TPA: gamma-glutamylcyclotransferase [Rubrivivax sp.]|nr:gamma-glutamylcyclotransferase [Rubrivivax sp.]
MDWSSLTLPARDPAALMTETMDQWKQHHAAAASGDLWLFGYASLIWRPEIEATEQRAATVHGWHRALEMRSRINRGTPECPGLVFALVAGGSCRGRVFRIPGDRMAEEIPRLWDREMPTGAYDPRWVACQTARGPVQALAFTLSRSSPSYTGRLTEAQLVDVLSRACGRYGSTLDYVSETARSLQACGIRDRGVMALMALARRHGLA